MRVWLLEVRTFLYQVHFSKLKIKVHFLRSRRDFMIMAAFLKSLVRLFHFGGLFTKDQPHFWLSQGEGFFERLSSRLFIGAIFLQWSLFIFFSTSSVYFLAPKKDQYQLLLLLIKDQEPLYSLSKPLLIKIKINPSVTKTFMKEKPLNKNINIYLYTRKVAE